MNFKPLHDRVLVRRVQSDEKTAGGIIKAEETLRIEETASVTGFVMAMGSDCYKDESKFPTGPWCKEGDWVVMRAFSGTRISIHGKEFRLINDDTVEAVIDDPRGIQRA